MRSQSSGGPLGRVTTIYADGMAVFDRMRIQLSSMINAETIQATPLASNTQNSDFDNVDGPNWRFDATALFLSSIAFFAG